MGVKKSLFVLVAAALSQLGGCTKANPNSCCTTADQCSQVGLKDVTSCTGGNVCDPYGACVKPQCSSSADCTSADTPICIDQLCVAKCAADADCAGRTGTPYCASDGVCVACTADSQCNADKPVCDADAHACRGCAADKECPDKVCLESAGTCAAASDVIFVRADGSDSGECPATAPCATLPYAFGKLSATRNVVHIIGGTLSVGANTVPLPGRSFYLDGENTLLRIESASPLFNTTGGAASVIFSHLTLGAAISQNQAIAVSAGVIELYRVTVPTKITITGGQLEVDHSLLSYPSLQQCSTGGALNVHDSTVQGELLTRDCTVTARRNVFDSPNNVGALNAGGNGVVTIENNVFISGDYFTDAVGNSGLPGSSVRFNTFVNLSGVDMGGQALNCGANVTASSNIIAWHSSAAPQCALTYSLFDMVAGLQPGTGNHVGDATTFFVDMQSKDLHLAPGSPAIGMGDPSTPVTDDIDGNPRPSPMGSSPDVGAYEAP